MDDDKYVNDNGDTVSSTTTLSAAAEDSASMAQFVISSSSKISTPATELTANLITPFGQTSDSADFAYKCVNGNDKRILVKMVLKKTLILGNYTVHIERNGMMTYDFPVKLTNVFYTPEMDFTAGNGA